MTKQSAIQSTIEALPFASLTISPLNPRTVINEESIDALAVNIRANGLIQNLAAYRAPDGTTGIVAGGRRYRALAKLQDDARFHNVPAIVTESEEVARIWAASENHMREQPHAADEVKEYGMLADKGHTVAAISVAFGVTEAHVYRRLALSKLPIAALDALKAGEISLGQAAAFTVSTDEGAILEVLEKTIRSHWFTEHHIKSALNPSAVKSNSRKGRFVGVEAYQAAGGNITKDLFEDEVLFTDPLVLAEVFEAKLTEAADVAKNNAGWAWAEISDETNFYSYEIAEMKLGRVYKVEGVLTEEEAALYDQLADLEERDEEQETQLAALTAICEGDYTPEQKAVAGIIAYVDHSGTIAFVEGLVRAEEREAAVEAGILPESQHSEKESAPKSPYSNALTMDLDRIKRGTRQNAALGDPMLLLQLLAFQLEGKSGYSTPFGISLDRVENAPSTETGFTLDDRLTTERKHPAHNTDLAKSFGAWRKKSDDEILAIVNRHLARQLTGGDQNLAAYIDKQLALDVRADFTPTAENILNRVGGPFLLGLWQELLGLAEDHPTVTTFAKLKKSEKADKLEQLFTNPNCRAALECDEAAEARIASWLPDPLK